MLRLDCNPDGSPDDIVITDPANIHIEDMGSSWWLRVKRADGGALVFEVFPSARLPRRLPDWLKGVARGGLNRRRLLEWMTRCVRLVAFVHIEETDGVDLQPAPLPSTGDVWAEVIADLTMDSPIRPLCEARRQLGINRYGTPLQRGNGRDMARDLEEELLDALAYARGAEDRVCEERLLELLKARLQAPSRPSCR